MLQVLTKHQERVCDFLFLACLCRLLLSMSFIDFNLRCWTSYLFQSVVHQSCLILGTYSLHCLQGICIKLDAASEEMKPNNSRTPLEETYSSMGSNKIVAWFKSMMQGCWSPCSILQCNHWTINIVSYHCKMVCSIVFWCMLQQLDAMNQSEHKRDMHPQWAYIGLLKGPGL